MAELFSSPVFEGIFEQEDKVREALDGPALDTVLDYQSGLAERMVEFASELPLVSWYSARMRTRLSRRCGSARDRGST